MRTHEEKSTRLDLRLSAASKELIEKAAILTGQTLTNFVVSSTLRTAQEVVVEQQRLVLTDRERDQFLKALDDATPPNKALRDAARRFNAHYRK